MAKTLDVTLNTWKELYAEFLKFGELNGVVHWYIGEAARAKANGRKTVRKHDFCACA